MTNVQVRDVSEPVLRTLRRRAVERQQSLQGYLLDVLSAEAAVADNAALLDHAAADLGNYAAAPGDAVREVRAARNARGDVVSR